MTTVTSIGEAQVFKKRLFAAEQSALLADVREVLRLAPFFTPVTRFGRPLSVKMTSAGKVGWISDRRGYRYETHHPTGRSWPEIPERIISVWNTVTDCERLPDTCLINHYGEGAKMGLHQDKDEVDLTHPVVSISLGDTAVFRMGGLKRNDPTSSMLLGSGDVVVLQGKARLAHHGIDRIRFRSSGLLPEGGRINLTLRIAT